MTDENPTDLPPRVIDLRGSPRKRVVFSGKVVHGGGAFSLDCRIRDMSDTGARIVIPRDQVIPTHLILLEVKSRAVYEAVVVRIAPPEYALKFTGKHSLDGLPTHLHYLKRFGPAFGFIV